MFYVSDINGIQTILTSSVSVNSISDSIITQSSEVAVTTADDITAQTSVVEDAVIVETALSPNMPLTADSLSQDSSRGIAMVSSGFVPNTKTSEGLATSKDTSPSGGGGNPFYQVTPIENIAASATAEFELPLEHVPPPHDPYRHANEAPTQRQRAISAAQIMTSPVVTLKSTELVEVAWKLFHQRRFRHLPVVSSTGRLVGILSDRDFLALGLDHIGVELTRFEQLHRPLSEIMRTNIVTCRPQTEIRAICQVMFAERIGAMPVVDEAGELVGILTGHDILKTLVNRAPLELWT